MLMLVTVTNAIIAVVAHLLNKNPDNEILTWGFLTLITILSGIMFLVGLIGLIVVGVF